MSELIEERRASLAIAIRSGDVGAVQQLLADGVSPNLRDERGWPAVLLAAQLRQCECMRALVDAGADVNERISDTAKNFRGYTALIMAPGADVGRILLEAGADPNAASEHQMTALDVAVASQDVEYTQLLLANGADVPDNLKDPQYWSGFNSKYEPVRRVIFAHLTACSVDAAMPIDEQEVPPAKSAGAGGLAL